METLLCFSQRNFRREVSNPFLFLPSPVNTVHKSTELKPYMIM